MSKNIVVTGGSRGIGYHIVDFFASNGYNVIFCSKNKSSLNKAFEVLNSKYEDVKIIAKAFDLSIKSEALAFAEFVKVNFSTLDILINNAGFYIPGEIHTDTDALESMINANLYSAYWVTNSLIPVMKSIKNGLIVNMSSVAGLAAYPNGGAYSISKFALTGYSKALRQELIAHNIKVTTIYPGATFTDSWSDSGIDESRFISPVDIAKTIYSLTSLSASAVIEDITIRPFLGDI